MSEAVDALERMFAVLLKEARANPRFAKALTAAMQGVVDTPPTRKLNDTGVDAIALYQQEGSAGLRTRLLAMRRVDILSLIKAQDLEPVGVSVFTKTRLVEHVVGVARRRTRVRYAES